MFFIENKKAKIKIMYHQLFIDYIPRLLPCLKIKKAKILQQQRSYTNLCLSAIIVNCVLTTKILRKESQKQKSTAL